jgi:hypothetical protein
VSDTFSVPPRRHGCLYEIASAVGGLILGLAIAAGLVAAALYFMGYEPW